MKYHILAFLSALQLSIVHAENLKVRHVHMKRQPTGAYVAVLITIPFTDDSVRSFRSDRGTSSSRHGDHSPTSGKHHSRHGNKGPSDIYCYLSCWGNCPYFWCPSLTDRLYVNPFTLTSCLTCFCGSGTHWMATS
jgi:hypothetical protein